MTRKRQANEQAYDRTLNERAGGIVGSHIEYFGYLPLTDLLMDRIPIEYFRWPEYSGSW